MEGQRQEKKSKNTKKHNQHTKIKALSFGSLGSNSFTGRPLTSIESGGGRAAAVCSSGAVEGVGVIMKLCEHKSR
jgi:hypothetical protein